jgi:hypothetical protein
MVVRKRIKAVLEAKGRNPMRHIALAALGALAACTTNDLSIPDGSVLYEVSPEGSVSMSGYDYGGTAMVNAPVTGPMPGPDQPAPRATPLDDDVLNLTLYTIEQQKIDARIAERQLAEARDQLVVVRPGDLPRTVAPEVNITLFAQQTRNEVGEQLYDRPFISNRLQARSTCRRFSNDDEAQRAFLANGGPQTDRYNLDPDGDGFACDWNPAPFRRLRL